MSWRLPRQQSSTVQQRFKYADRLAWDRTLGIARSCGLQAQCRKVLYNIQYMSLTKPMSLYIMQVAER